MQVPINEAVNLILVICLLLVIAFLGGKLDD